jgi:hypothetical protein
MVGKLLLVSGFFALSVLGCKNAQPNIVIKTTAVSLDSLKLKSYADTIVCDMVVKNPDKEDLWMEDCLKQLHREPLIDTIFNEIYIGRLIAYDFVTGKPLTIKEVKRLEETSGYSRDIIGKFQFKEIWYYDNKNHVFIKKVHSIIFGFETFDDKGFVKGYKPLFKVAF